MSLEIKNERKIPYTVFDIDISNEEAARLKEIGLREIQKDDEALIQYAVEHILRQFTNDLTKNVARLKELVKKEKREKRVKKT